MIDFLSSEVNVKFEVESEVDLVALLVRYQLSVVPHLHIYLYFITNIFILIFKKFHFLTFMIHNILYIIFLEKHELKLKNIILCESPQKTHPVRCCRKLLTIVRRYPLI